MSRDRRRLIDYLGHMLEAVKQAGLYVVGMDESEFLGNRLVQDAVIRNIEIVGEASRNIERHYPDMSGRIRMFLLPRHTKCETCLRTAISR